jgi:DNA-binding MarR family transcriptional regulator
MARTSKRALIDRLVTAFRAAGNLDSAFDNLAAERLGVNRTDLHCLNAIENAGGLTAGQLAAEAGLTTGAVTGVVDRLERAGLARRVLDPDDRRRVRIEVTPAFRDRAGEIWGPVRADWDATLAARFTVADLVRIIAFLEATNAIAARHVARLERGA